MKKLLLAPILLWWLTGFAPSLLAQCENYSSVCQPKLSPYITDGKVYAIDLNEGQTVRINYTFYSGSQYRLLTCGNPKKYAQTKPGSLIFKIFDQQSNLLFSNEKFPEVAFRDFVFNATGNYLVEVTFSSGAGCAVVMVGFNDFLYD